MKTTFRSALTLSLCVGLFSIAQAQPQDQVSCPQLLESHKGADPLSLDQDVIASIARCHMQMLDNLQAARWFEKIADMPDCKSRYLLEYGQCLKSLKLYGKAKFYFQKYAQHDPVAGNQFMQSCDIAKMLMDGSSMYMVSPVPSNTSSTEFSPALWTNKVLYLRWQSTAPMPEITAMQKEDASLFLKWKLLPSGCSHMAFTPDGNTAAFASHVFQPGQRLFAEGRSMKIYLAEMTGAGNWADPVAMPFCSDSYSTGYPSFSPDGMNMYFASNMPGGKGGWDLYVCKKMGDTWSKPENLGSEVNTPGNEISPFCTQEKMYFSSDWHIGIGGFDVFVASLVEAMPRQVQNLGYPVNSPKDELNFIWDMVADCGYFSSNRIGGMGLYDLYRCTPDFKEIECTVISKEAMKPLANVKLTLSPGAAMASYTNTQGIATMQMPGNGEYEVVARKDGYLDQKMKITADALIAGNLKLYLEAAPSAVSKMASATEKEQTAPAVTKTAAPAPEVQKTKTAATNTKAVNAKEMYFIQIAALARHASLDEYEALRSYGDLLVYDDGKLAKVRVGTFETESAAKIVLSRIRTDGYPDAFVVKDSPDKTQMTTSFSGSSAYKVRLGTYSRIGSFNADLVMNLGSVESYRKDDLTIMLLAGYADLPAAQKARDAAASRGFTDAYVVMDNGGVLERVR